ncbi:MAG: triose-phosphate isomerase [Rickettsiales bacterium]|nr:triose-phosphate isomerase [Rickettsiales bacterium]
MSSTRYVIANFKMNAPALPAWMQAVSFALLDEAVEVVVCPPYTQLAAAQMVSQGVDISIGAQDCHHEATGAYTGSISADMIKRAGCSYVLVGHSERRQEWSESNELVWKKAVAAVEQGITPVVCVGESNAEHEAGKTLDVISKQLEGANALNSDDYLVAYEPIWAIGTGKTPNADDIARTHAAIKKQLEPSVPVLYGGSVKPANASEIFEIVSVDGVLVGGASLDGESFGQIIVAAGK